MYKRSRDQLTGGTKDVNPQFFNMSVTQSGTDVYTQVAAPIPIQRMQLGGGRSQVMEILKIWIQGTDPVPMTSATVVVSQATLQITTKSQTATVALTEPTVVGFYMKSYSSAFTATGSYAVQSGLDPYQLDLTDGAGHGVIVGAPVFNMRQYTRYVSNPPGATGEMLLGVRIMYRIKGIPYDEWVRQFTFGI